MPLTVEAARWAFFQAIRRIYLDAIRDLEDSWTALCQLSGEEHESALVALFAAYHHTSRIGALAWDSDGQRKLRETIESWQKRWNLNEDWCFYIVAVSLFRWKSRPDFMEELAFRYFELPSFVDPPVFHFNPHVESWYPSLEAPVAFKAKLLARYAAEIDAFQRRVEEEKGGRISKRNLEHLEWTVRCQVGGESFRSIAGRNADEQRRHTVSGAVKSTAEVIGLRLRPASKGGRPRKPVG
jgi:hypothetical protein